MAKIITRRWLLTGFAAASLLAGCDARHPVAGFLKSMLRFNESFEVLRVDCATAVAKLVGEPADRRPGPGPAVLEPRLGRADLPHDHRLQAPL